ncbi:MAG TPA: TolC family protein [Planctomycetes bacterium]|nr:TolC family protein [Planctomycetota bacterium]
MTATKRCALAAACGSLLFMASVFGGDAAADAPPQTAHAATPLSLDDCRSLAVLGNTDLQRSVIENRRKELSLWKEEGLFLPDLSFSLSHAHDTDAQSASFKLSGSSPFGTSISATAKHDWDRSSADSGVTLSVTQPLLDNSTRTEKLSSLWRTRIDAAVQRNTLERKIESVLYDAHARYIECVKQELTIKVNQRALERTTRLYEATREKERLGAATVLDLADVEATLASRKIALAESRQALESALDSLKTFLNIDVGTPLILLPVAIDLEETETERTRTRIVVNENDLAIILATHDKQTGLNVDRKIVFEAAHIDPGAVMTRALAHRLDLANAGLAQAKSYLDYAVARTGLKPNLDLTFSYNKSGSGATSRESLPLDEESWSLGLSLSLPIGNRSDRLAFESALLDYERARLALRDAEQSVKSEVRSVLRDLNTSCRNVLNYALQVRAAGLALESARVTYELGKTDFFRVLDAENNFLSAQRSFIRTYLDYELLLSRLRLVMGEDSGRLAELVMKGRELSRRLKEDLAPAAPQPVVRQLFMQSARPDEPFHLPAFETPPSP